MGTLLAHSSWHIVCISVVTETLYGVGLSNRRWSSLPREMDVRAQNIVLDTLLAKTNAPSVISVCFGGWTLVCTDAQSCGGKLAPQPLQVGRGMPLHIIN